MNKINNNTKRILLPLYVVTLFISISLFYYFYFFQVTSFFSIKRFLFSFVLGGVTLFAFVAPLVLRKKTDLFLSEIKFSLIFLQAIVFLCYFQFFIPQPVNHLFSKLITLDISFQQNPISNSPVEVLWINNGLRDLPLREIDYFSGEIIDGMGLQLIPDSNGLASFKWEGPAWETITIVIRSTTPLEIQYQINGTNFTDAYHPNINQDYRLEIAATGRVSGILAVIIILLSKYLTFVFFLLVLYSISLYLKNQKIVILQKIPKLNDSIWLVISNLPLMTIIIYLVTIGLNNRLYSDDYCHFVFVRDEGYFQTVQHALTSINGRFMGIIADFFLFIWEDKLMPFGMLFSILLACGSLLFVIYQFIDLENKLQKFLTSLLLSSLITLSIYYLTPSLYESTFWSLYAMLINGGIVFFNTAIVILLNTMKKELISKRRMILSGFSLFIMGIIACGFHENVSMLIILISGSILIGILLSRRKINNYRNILKLLIIFISGSFMGFCLNVFSIGMSRLLTSYHVSYNLQSKLISIYDLIALKLNVLYEVNQAIGFLIIALTGIVVYFIGRQVSIYPVFSDIKINRFLGISLFLFPLAPFLISFIPSTFISNYYPNRTLIVPLYFFVTTLFFLAFFSGVRKKDETKTYSLQRIIIIALVFIISITFWLRFEPYGIQFRQFVAEWDARDALIREAVKEGKEEIQITPYEYNFGIDLTTTNNTFLNPCINSYYGINVIPPQ